MKGTEEKNTNVWPTITEVGSMNIEEITSFVTSHSSEWYSIPRDIRTAIISRAYSLRDDDNGHLLTIITGIRSLRGQQPSVSSIAEAISEKIGRTSVDDTKSNSSTASIGNAARIAMQATTESRQDANLASSNMNKLEESGAKRIDDINAQTQISLQNAQSLSTLASSVMIIGGGMALYAGALGIGVISSELRAWGQYIFPPAEEQTSEESKESPSGTASRSDIPLNPTWGHVLAAVRRLILTYIRAQMRKHDE